MPTLDAHMTDDLTLREFFENRFESLEEGQDRIEGKVDKAVTQSTLTNGRVTNLELENVKRTARMELIKTIVKWILGITTPILVVALVALSNADKL